jgi:hypothetical protein
MRFRRREERGHPEGDFRRYNGATSEHQRERIDDQAGDPDERIRYESG